MAVDKIQTGIRFEEEILEKLKFIAKVNRRSLNAKIEFLAINCIEEYEAKKGVIKIKKDDSD